MELIYLAKNKKIKMRLLQSAAGKPVNFRENV